MCSFWARVKICWGCDHDLLYIYFILFFILHLTLPGMAPCLTRQCPCSNLSGTYQRPLTEAPETRAVWIHSWQVHNRTCFLSHCMAPALVWSWVVHFPCLPQEDFWLSQSSITLRDPETLSHTDENYWIKSKPLY